MVSHFELLGLTPAFDLDLKALESAYFQAQREFHPDRFVGKPEGQRLQGMQKSADINQAYQTLKEPLPRAQYLLHLQGIAVATDTGGVKPSQALLMETLEWREQVAAAPGAQELDKLEKTLKDMRLQTIEMIGQGWQNARWQDMAQATLRLGYIEKALEEVRIQRKRKK